MNLSVFQYIYAIAQKHRVEVAGTVYAEDGKWRLSSIVFGDAHTVPCPVSNGNELTYHVHIPHGGQICMPPSPQDWLVLIRNGLKAAFVISREGVYKFWWKEEVYEKINKMQPVEALEWMREVEALESKLNAVHGGELSITEYKKAVSELCMCMEFRS